MVTVNYKVHCRRKDQNCFFRSLSEKIVLYSGHKTTQLHQDCYPLSRYCAVVTVVTTVTAALRDQHLPQKICTRIEIAFCRLLSLWSHLLYDLAPISIESSAKWSTTLVIAQWQKCSQQQGMEPGLDNPSGLFHCYLGSCGISELRNPWLDWQLLKDNHLCYLWWSAVVCSVLLGKAFKGFQMSCSVE